MAEPKGALESTRLPGVWGGLRPLDAKRDVQRIYELQRNGEAATWFEMKVGPFADEAAFARHVGELLADAHRAFFAIADANNAALGWLCLMEAQPAHRTIELGYVLFTPPLRRTTLATEAFFLILSHVFEDLGYQRLE